MQQVDSRPQRPLGTPPDNKHCVLLLQKPSALPSSACDGHLVCCKDVTAIGNVRYRTVIKFSGKIHLVYSIYWPGFRSYRKIRWNYRNRYRGIECIRSIKLGGTFRTNTLRKFNIDCDHCDRVVIYRNLLCTKDSYYYRKINMIPLKQ